MKRMSVKIIFKFENILKQPLNSSIVGDRSLGRSEGSLFNGYYTDV